MQDTLTLPKSLQCIIDSLNEEDKIKPSTVVRIVKEAKVQQDELMLWADFDHPKADSYGRKLVFKNDKFEVMVMSWVPGDFSGLHDHGYTQWGAVKIFGAAEHATFRVEDGYISTLARWTVKPGDVIGVGHSLVHQMGNPGEQNFLSLHVYGDVNPHEHITGDARVFNLRNKKIEKTNGGVFFAMPKESVVGTEPGPSPDFPTLLRYNVEFSNRLKKMSAEDRDRLGQSLDESVSETFSASLQNKLIKCLSANVDDDGHQNNSLYWKALNTELKAAAQLQNELKGVAGSADKFHKYNEVYDGLICAPSMESFMKDYLDFFVKETNVSLADSDIISLGCGTGYVEDHMILEMGADRNRMYGIDISAAMVETARARIKADVGDVLTLDPEIKMWDIAYSGLNVFQYLDFHRLEEAIHKTAGIIKSGGYFVGDFISPDHIRWYPNVMYSADKKAISLRTPALIENEGRMFQESEIINISFMSGSMEVNYAGEHRRFLPPLHRMRMYFESAFGGKVELRDAHSLEIIPDWADSCASTRYIIIAQKQ